MSRGSFNSIMTKLLYHIINSFQFNAARKVNVADSNSPNDIQRQQSPFQCMQGSCGCKSQMLQSHGELVSLTITLLRIELTVAGLA